VEATLRVGEKSFNCFQLGERKTLVRVPKQADIAAMLECLLASGECAVLRSFRIRIVEGNPGKTIEREKPTTSCGE